MIRCPECKKIVDEKNNSCQYCGCFIVPIAAARCMSTAPTTASAFSLSEVQRAVRHMAITHISQANREKELKADGTISSERHAD